MVDVDAGDDGGPRQGLARRARGLVSLMILLLAMLASGTPAVGAAQLASQVDVVKSVEGLADDEGWSFDFVISPVPPGEVATKTASGVGNGAGGVSWAGLVPGATYTISEVTQTGFEAGPMLCTVVDDIDGDSTDASVQFVAPGGTGNGTDFACSIVNTVQLASQVDVVKSVEGLADDEGWSFDFVISPVPPGEVATKTASGVGNGAGGVSWAGLVPGATYTISEVTQTGFEAGPMLCTVVDDIDGDSTDASVQFVAPGGTGNGTDFACSIVNTVQLASQVDVVKSVEGLADDEGWSFDFVISPVPPGEVATKTASGVGNGAGGVSWAGLVPGATYTISEVTQTGFEAGPMLCTVVDDIDGDPTDASVQFVAPGGTGNGTDFACSIVNTCGQTW